MKEQFVPYELALKLKELGFDDLCLARFNGGGFYMLPAYDPLRNSEIKEPWFCTSPLWQQAFDWFRKKGYDSNIAKTVALLISCAGHKPYYYSVCESGKEFDTYEEARQACLEKLIELVETKKDSI